MNQYENINCYLTELFTKKTGMSEYFNKIMLKAISEKLEEKYYDISEEQRLFLLCRIEKYKLLK
jgi:hypothetical protein